MLWLSEPSSQEKPQSFLTGQSGARCRSSHRAHGRWRWYHAGWPQLCTEAPKLEHFGDSEQLNGVVPHGAWHTRERSTISSQPCKAEDHTGSGTGLHPPVTRKHQRLNGSGQKSVLMPGVGPHQWLLIACCRDTAKLGLKNGGQRVLMLGRVTGG